MSELIEILVRDLKARCNKHTNGVCMNRSCLVRGGYKIGDVVDYSIATCIAHEQVKELEKLTDK